MYTDLRRFSAVVANFYLCLLVDQVEVFWLPDLMLPAVLALLPYILPSDSMADTRSCLNLISVVCPWSNRTKRYTRLARPELRVLVYLKLDMVEDPMKQILMVVLARLHRMDLMVLLTLLDD